MTIDEAPKAGPGKIRRRPKPRSDTNGSIPPEAPQDQLEGDPVLEASAFVTKSNAETSGTPIVTLMFVWCLIVGTILALLGISSVPFLRTLGVLGPIGATIFYPVWGFMQRLHRRASVRERFADNCYYLGFIFTQIALVFGFLPVALLNRDITSHDVLRFFGLALGASLVGLVARTFFVQTGHTVTENAEIIENEVDALARTVSTKSRQVLEEFESISKKLGQTYDQFGANLDRASSAIEKTMGRFDFLLSRDVEQLEREGGKVSIATAEAAFAISEQNAAFGETIKRAAEAIEGLKAGLLKQAAEAGRAIDQTSASLNLGLQSLQEVTVIAESVKVVDLRLSNIDREIVEMSGKIGEASRAISRTSGEAVTQAETEIAHAKATAVARAEAFHGDVQTAVYALEQTLISFRAEMERVRG